MNYIPALKAYHCFWCPYLFAVGNRELVIKRNINYTRSRFPPRSLWPCPLLSSEGNSLEYVFKAVSASFILVISYFWQQLSIICEPRSFYICFLRGRSFQLVSLRVFLIADEASEHALFPDLLHSALQSSFTLETASWGLLTNYSIWQCPVGKETWNNWWQ